MIQCKVCFRQCVLAPGQTGACGARRNRDEIVEPVFYGRVSSLALDPIEKKPLMRFHPGSRILSVGSLGCNLRCPFCQNHEIAQRDETGAFSVLTEAFPPERLAALAEETSGRGNIGIAFTYNEPLVNYEYVRDTARLVKERGMVCVLVTNGTASPDVLRELQPYVDAMNIDLKGFTDRYYRDVLGGDLEMTKAFIREAAKTCHVELTALIVPGENDSEAEMQALSAWVAGISPDIPLHVSRFFPRHRMADRPPTPVQTVYRLAEIARQNLRYVYTGNC